MFCLKSSSVFGGKCFTVRIKWLSYNKTRENRKFETLPYFYTEYAILVHILMFCCMALIESDLCKMGCKWADFVLIGRGKGYVIRYFALWTGIKVQEGVLRLYMFL